MAALFSRTLLLLATLACAAPVCAQQYKVFINNAEVPAGQANYKVRAADVVRITATYPGLKDTLVKDVAVKSCRRKQAGNALSANDVNWSFRNYRTFTRTNGSMLYSRTKTETSVTFKAQELSECTKRFFWVRFLHKAGVQPSAGAEKKFTFIRLD